MLKLSGFELFQEIEILAAGYPSKIVKKNSAQSHNINIKNVYWTENQKVKINKDMHLYIHSDRVIDTWKPTEATNDIGPYLLLYKALLCYRQNNR